jgi:hypothetical protein
MYLRNEGWEPNWCTTTFKFVIYYIQDRIETNMSNRAQSFLAFKSAEIRDKFLEDFKDLIKEAKPLL